MAAPEPSLTPVASFVSAFWMDVDRGTVRTLEEYLRQFPGDAEAIAAEYLSLKKRSRAGGDSTIASARAGREEAPEFVGPYRIEKLLGRGGQGSVHLAFDTRLQRKVALKILTSLSAADPAVFARFQREATIASHLDHPGICAVYDTGIDAGVPYIAMRHVEGRTLAQEIAAARGTSTPKADTFHETALEAAPPPESPIPATIKVPASKSAIGRILLIFEKAARALHVAHEAGIVHRDLKPGNLMLNAADEPVILDFGLAWEESPDLAAITRTGDLFGTPAYMSPEQTKAQRLDRRTDIWSLGVSLYEALTLERPFEAVSRDALSQAIRDAKTPSVRHRNPALSREVETILAMALEKDRDRRYQTAEALAEDLRRIRMLEPILARRPSPWLRSRRWIQRNRAIAAAIAVVVLGLSIGLTITLAALAESRRSLVEKQTALAAADASEQSALAGAAHAALAAARLSSRNGEWDEALEHLAVAEGTGCGDHVEIAITRIEAFDGKFDTDRAIDELRKLVASFADRRLPAKVLLLRGDLGHDRWSDPDAGVDDIRAALEPQESPLQPADAAYARALLAPTAEESLGHCREALHGDSSHRLARQLSIALTLILGDVVTLADEAKQFRALYPGDPVAMAAEALACSLDGRKDRVRAILDELKGQVAPEAHSFLGFVMDLLGTAREHLPPLALATMARDEKAMARPNVALTGVLVRTVLKLGLMSKSAGSLGELKITFRPAPAMAKALGPLARLVMGSLKNLGKSVFKPDIFPAASLRAPLESWLAYAPNGICQLILMGLDLGSPSFDNKKFITQGQQILTLPSLFDIRDAARCLYVLAVGHELVQNGRNPACLSPEQITATKQVLADLVHFARWPPQLAENASEIAVILGERELANLIIDARNVRARRALEEAEKK